MSTNRIVMKLTDIDLSSLAEVADALTLLKSAHAMLCDTSATPLPEIIVNPAPPLADQNAEAVLMARDPRGLRRMVDERLPISTAVQALQSGVRSPDIIDRVRADLGLPPHADAMAAEDASRHVPHMQPGCEPAVPMDAATVFGGAPAQSAAPLPQFAPATADAAASPTAPAAPLASGALPALQALAPLPAPSAAAPAAPVAQPSHAGGVDLDTDGLPWDARIHAGTKRKNDDGRWSRKRGINDPDLVPRVEAQLRAQMAAGGLVSGNINAHPVATAPAPHVKVESVDAFKTLAALPPAPPGSLGAALGVPQMTLAQLQEAQMLANVTPPVVAQSAAPSMPPVLHAAPAPTTFQDFMTALTVEVQSGRVPIEALGAACQPLGGVSALNAKPELIPVAWASLKAKYPGML